MELANGIGSPPVNLEFTTIANGSVVTPLALPGDVIAREGVVFLRGDADQNGTIQLTDAVFLLDYLFRGGEALPAPFLECGVDSTDDELDCEAEPICP